MEGLKARGLHGVEFVVSDDHPGLKKTIPDVLTGVFAGERRRRRGVACIPLVGLSIVVPISSSASRLVGAGSLKTAET